MNDKVVNTAMNHLDRICDFGGRLSGSVGEMRALDYIRDVFEGCNVGRIETHKVAYDGWRCDTAAIELGGKSLPMNALPGSTSLDGGAAELEIIDAGCHCTLINQILRIGSVFGRFCTLNCNISTGRCVSG